MTAFSARQGSEIGGSRRIVPGRRQKFDTCSQLQYYEFLDAGAANLGPSQHEFASAICMKFHFFSWFER
jgi:hypothetical protein